MQRYVPSFPQKQYPVTTRQLAGHLAGIRHYSDNDPISDCNKSFETVLEGLQIFQNDPLLFKPGTKHTYSSYGFNLIGAVIEGASGKDFLNYVRDAVLEPLGMRNTVADRNRSIIEGRTRFYERGADKQINNAPCIDSSYKWASGGMLSTAEDLAHLGSAFLRPGFLKRETLAVVFTPQRLALGEESPMHEGLGWRIKKKEGGGRVFHHGGTIEGGRAFILLDEKSGVVVVLLSNMFAPYGESEAGEIASMFVKR